MLSIIRLLSSRAMHPRASLITRPSSLTASASGAGPALAPIATVWRACRGLATSTDSGQPTSQDAAFHTQLNDQDLNKGLVQETSLARASKPFDVEYLRKSMARRPHRATYDHLSPTHSHLLNIALYDVLPRGAQAGAVPDKDEASALLNPFALPVTKEAAGTLDDHTRVLPAGHHLVYYPLQRPISLLEPDGTDPNQSPGIPFVRRMWAGGSLHFQKPQQLVLDGQRTVCVEGLDTKNMVMRGGPGREKIFVDVVRRYGSGLANLDRTNASQDQVLELEDAVWQAPALEERRTLVFMRAKDDVPEDASKETAKPKPKPQEERVIKGEFPLRSWLSFYSIAAHPNIYSPPDTAVLLLLHAHIHLALPVQCPLLQHPRHPPRRQLLP